MLGSEFDILIHETDELVDAGLLAALAGTVKAGGVLVLGLPFPLDLNEAASPISHFNQRFARLLSDMLLRFPAKVLRLKSFPDSDSIALEVTFLQTW